MNLLLVFVISFVSALLGFFFAALLAASKRADIEKALARFASPSNWITGVVKGAVVHVWNGGGNPVEIAQQIKDK